MWPATSWRSATFCMYAQISDWWANAWLQRGFGSFVYEYRTLAMSQPQPGYEWSRHVPPRSPARSSPTKSSIPSWRSAIAIPRPDRPAPTIAIWTSRRSASSMGDLLVWAPGDVSSVHHRTNPVRDHTTLCETAWRWNAAHPAPGP